MAAVSTHLDTFSDGWLDEGVALTKDLPGLTIDEFVHGSGRMLMILPDNGRYYLHNPNEKGYMPFDNLSEAKDAGDRVVNALADRLQDALTRDAGLDPESWKFRSQDRFVWFESAASPDTRVERYGPTRWLAIRDGYKAGVASSPAKAVEMHLDPASPRP